MSTNDPFRAPGGLQHLRATVLWSIIPEVIFFVAIATGVTLISHYTTTQLHIATTLLTVFGTVLGFIVSYRTSSAYERYSEGRRLWATVTLATRTFARITWHHVPNYLSPPEPGKTADEREAVRALTEKKTIINLTGAFSVALKHYLRGESGIFYKDLYPLVCFLPKYALPNSTFKRTDLDIHHRNASTPSTSPSMSYSEMTPTLSNEKSTFPPNPSATDIETLIAPDPPSATLHHRRTGTTSSSAYALPPTRRLTPPIQLLPSRNPPPVTPAAYIPFYDFFSDIFHYLSGRVRSTLPGKRRRRIPIEHSRRDIAGENVPLELTLFLSGWIAALQRRKTIDVPTTNSLLAAVQSFSECLTGLERILLTPIPVAYSLHLRHTVWIYLFLLPAQLHDTFGWITIPATAIASVVFLGFIQIGQEIESPFGYDDNDLDLDAFNRTILRELREITAHPPSECNPDNFCFVDENLPFAVPPFFEGKSAVEIVEDGTSLSELESLLRRTGTAKTEKGSELRRIVSLGEEAERVGKRQTKRGWNGV